MVNASQNKTYKKSVGFSCNIRLKEMTKDEIKRRFDRWDEKVWSQQLMKKSTLALYSQYKNKINEESFYANTNESVLMFRARTSTLQLK